jgi:hypothetical protein
MSPQEEPAELPEPTTFARQGSSRIAGKQIPCDQAVIQFGMAIIEHSTPDLMLRQSHLCPHAGLHVACFELFGRF